MHNCTTFLCSLDVGNIEDQYRGPSKNEKDHLVVTNLTNNDDDGVRAPVTFCLYLVRTSTVRGRGLFIFYYFLFQEIIFYYFLLFQARPLYCLLFSVPSRNYFDQTNQQSSDDEVAENNSKQFNSVSSLDYYRFINFQI